MYSSVAQPVMAWLCLRSLDADGDSFFSYSEAMMSKEPPRSRIELKVLFLARA